MQPNNPNQPKSTDGFRPSGSDYRPNTDGFARPTNYSGNNQLPPTMPSPNVSQNSQPRPTISSNNPYQPHGQTAPTYNPNDIPAPTNQPVTGQNDLAAAKNRKKRDEIKNTLFTIALFILAPLFAVFMIIFVFQSYVVDGSSMEPTLQNGDRVFILKLPKSLAEMRNQEWVPARNEIIVFKKPENEGTQLIKRVIGLPGDRVVIENGVITVYNIDNPGGFDPDAGTEYEGKLAEYDSEQNIEANVGEGELFVLGDNRSPGGSLDSHSGLGLVPIDHVVGRLWIRYFPLSSFEVYANLQQLRLAI